MHNVPEEGVKSKFLCRAEQAKGGCGHAWDSLPGMAFAPNCPACGVIYFIWADHPLTKRYHNASVPR